jgi:hypothetical protein
MPQSRSPSPDSQFSNGSQFSGLSGIPSDKIFCDIEEIVEDMRADGISIEGVVRIKNCETDKGNRKYSLSREAYLKHMAKVHRCRVGDA